MILRWTEAACKAVAAADRMAPQMRCTVDSAERALSACLGSPEGGASMNVGGCRALVTGASGGLGVVIARRLHAEGAHLVLSGRREDDLHALAAELGGQTRTVPADL